ncbi:GNAT family N-acetyltransferase [Bacillus sp. FJAT-47783]|uniref:GNAT family N-acetyltransferase n=1 Tax=Bacillus sp. FJAT-47783 TaxID=2922712 RepID=UPI001FAE3CEF|nr:GNAT family N-acetyltransferase [Bacillus sp. FJAT-47783]
MLKAIIVTKQNELEDAFNVRKKVFVHEQNVPLELEIDDFEEEATHVVVYDEETPVGAGRLRLVDGFGKLERICVLSSYRGKGAGSIVMEKLEEIAHQKGVSKVKLNAQTTAEAFYQKLGYETISEDVFLDAGIPHVSMMKSIR